jgi:hypothetical protein
MLLFEHLIKFVLDLIYNKKIFFFYLKVAIQYPAAVTACNVDLETLITDSNRSIATLAITTLLKVFFILVFYFFYLMILIFRQEMKLVLID